MITREQLLNSIQHDVNVCKHLYSKITPDRLNFRPTPGQRSLLELLQYLTVCGIAPISGLLTGDWTEARQASEKSKENRFEDFCNAMDRQMAEIKKMVHDIPEADFQSKEVSLPTGQKSVLGQALLNFPLKFMAAYRMQLFLYLKESGLSELNTYNAWMGIDKPMDM